MKLKIFYLLFLLFISQNLYSNRVIPLFKNEKKLVVKFVKAVNKKNTKKIMNCLSSNYIKIQHDNLLNGNTKQFIDELFCGKNKNDKFNCYYLSDIIKIEYLEISNVNRNIIYFKINNNNNESLIINLIMVYETDYSIKFEGAVG